MNERGPHEEAHNEEAWRLYMEAERRELRMRQEGHLAKLLGRALPDESPEELERMAEDDRLRAEEGLVDLMDEHGQITYKHKDELAPEDRPARLRSEGARIEWLSERQAKRPPSPSSPSPTDPVEQ
jgi:hypothetical protein